MRVKVRVPTPPGTWMRRELGLTMFVYQEIPPMARIRKSKTVLALEDRIRAQERKVAEAHAGVKLADAVLTELRDTLQAFEQAESKRGQKKKPATAARPGPAGQVQ